ncbi:unnamed protein product [Ixodes hexagonus]
MTQYPKVFSAYRVPRLNCDRLEFNPSKDAGEQISRDVLVIHNNQCDDIFDADPKNAESLEAIKKAAFVLCLDKKPNVEDTDELTGCRQIFLGGTDGENGANRWLDKTVQLIVGETGHNGFLMEHTPVDGEAMLGLADHCCDYM